MVTCLFDGMESRGQGVVALTVCGGAVLAGESVLGGVWTERALERLVRAILGPGSVCTAKYNVINIPNLLH